MKPPTKSISQSRRDQQYTQRIRERASIARAIDEKNERKQRRDEQERAIDHAVSRNIEWARRQYILRLPGDLNTKHNLIHGAEE